MNTKIVAAVASIAFLVGCDSFHKPEVTKTPVIEVPVELPAEPTPPVMDKPAPPVDVPIEEPASLWPQPVVPPEPEGPVEGTVPEAPDPVKEPKPWDDPRWHKPVPKQPPLPDVPFRPQW